jgi:nucleoid DNA-binding protein
MNKEQFAKYISENMEYELNTAKFIIDVFAEHIYLAISEGHEIDISNLGKFTLKGNDTKKHLSFTPSVDLKIAYQHLNLIPNSVSEPNNV